MRRNLTESERAARDQRREAFRSLASKVAAMPEAERAELSQRLPLVTVEGHALSCFNACLVAMQRPTASIVGGFAQWIKAGRVVRKGEHGLALWVPLKPGKREDDRHGDTPGAGAKRMGFIMGTVFDVSQTDELERAS